MILFSLHWGVKVSVQVKLACEFCPCAEFMLYVQELVHVLYIIEANHRVAMRAGKSSFCNMAISLRYINATRRHPPLPEHQLHKQRRMASTCIFLDNRLPMRPTEAGSADRKKTNKEARN